MVEELIGDKKVILSTIHALGSLIDTFFENTSSGPPRQVFYPRLCMTVATLGTFTLGSFTSMLPTLSPLLALHLCRSRVGLLLAQFHILPWCPIVLCFGTPSNGTQP
ncbi:hypothetical protein V6Z12_D10G020600 [Gossypium hirsutum]